MKKYPNWKEFQVGFIVIDKPARVGGSCIQPGFEYAVYDKKSGNRMVTAPSHLAAKQA